MIELDSSAPEAGSKEKPYLFVSYARKDRDVVYPEVARLQRAGYRLWCDRRDIPTSSEWLDEIMKAIEDCDGFLIFLSEASAGSAFVPKEIDQARNFAKPIIPIFIEKVQLPPELDGKVGQIQGLEFYSLMKSEYEVNLSAALFDCVGAPRSNRLEGEPFWGPRIIDFPPRPKAGPALPKVFLFSLILMSGFFGMLAVIAFVSSYFPVFESIDPEANAAAFPAGIISSVIAVGLAIPSFAVYWLFVRRIDG